jgi:eukaryotic-like serine/threonine-protein kinase
MAYARLGVVYINSGQVTKATRYFSKAFELSKNVSERERLYITGHYYENVAGDIPKVIETLQEAIQAYPGQIDNYININVAYQSLGQYEQGLPYAQKGVELDPQDSIASENLLSDYVALGRMAEAKKELERTQALGLNSSTDDLVSYMVTYFLLGEPQQAQRTMAQLAGRQDEFLATQALSATQQYAGQYRLAEATLRRATDQAARAKASDAQAGFLLQGATALGLAGLCESNEKAVQEAMSLDKSKQTHAAAALTAAVCGNSKVALPLALELGKKFPQDTLVQNVYAPLSKAFVALAEGHAQEAVDAAEPAKPYDANYPASYVQGLAYLQLHDATHALSAFQAAVRANAGTVQLGYPPYRAQVQLGLARAYAMGGDKASAKKAYEAGFVIWKDADADLPMLLAAKKEYAAL